MSVRTDARSEIVYLLTYGTELGALRLAEEGDPTQLNEIIVKDGILNTEEARQFVAARLRGDKMKAGNKRTRAQKSADLSLYVELRKICQDNNQCTEYRARKIMLEKNESLNEETLKTTFRRIKREMFRAWDSTKS